jgi:hypothetical protein
VQAHDYRNQRAYRLINPEFVKKHKKESKRRSVEHKEAWDDVNYVDLETDDDWFQKALAIEAGEDYDTRVEVPLTLDKEQMHELMTMAHVQDITLNQLVESILRQEIERIENGI